MRPFSPVWPRAAAGVERSEHGEDGGQEPREDAHDIDTLKTGREQKLNT